MMKDPDVVKLPEQAAQTRWSAYCSNSSIMGTPRETEIIDDKSNRDSG